MNKFIHLFILLNVCIFSTLAEKFPLHIVHINDFHARFEPTDTSAGTCDGEGCIGGYARTVYTVKRLLRENAAYNPIYLNAGDNFQGTLWYNIGRWNVTSQFLNMLPADAVTLGNHEFDNGVAGCVPFLETLNSPVVVANMDVSEEPTMENKFKKSIVIERSGRKIGIVGLLLETVYSLADIGKLKFTNEVEALKTEAQKLRAEGVNIIIALTHCGYDLDQEIAKAAGSDVDVIVGSHSHTFLYTGTPPADFPFKAGAGDYPTVIEQTSGHRTLIVQASSYARFVGDIRVYFDDEGEVLDWEGAPIYLSADVPEDEEVKAAIVPWKEIIDVRGKVKIGSSQVTLEKESCYSAECNLGNFYCDALVHSFLSQFPYDNEDWAEATVGLTNPGGLRTALFKGNLSYSHMLTMSPFENELVALDLTGKQLIAALEYGFSARSMLQVSGLRVTFDSQKPTGQQLVDVKVRCAKCAYPKYEPIDTEKYYRIITASFLAGGGDGFTMFSEGLNKKVGQKDIDALVDYTNSISPITTGLEKRIIIL